MKLKLNILCFLLVTSLTPFFALASGGWVGNSPMTIAHYSPEIFGHSAISSDTELAAEEWNSLLLPKGMSRLGFEWGMLRPKNFESIYYLNLTYQYAFTEKITTDMLLHWGYSLLSGNGQGHELAAYFGIYGLGYSTYTGTVLAPGVGLGYAFTEDAWRFSTKFIFLNSYYFKDSNWGRAQVQSDSALTYKWNEKWATGLAVKATITEADDQLEEFALRNSQDLFRPSVTIGRTLKKFGANKQDLDIEVGVGLDDIRNSSLGISWTW